MGSIIHGVTSWKKKEKWKNKDTKWEKTDAYQLIVNNRDFSNKENKVFYSVELTPQSQRRELREEGGKKENKKVEAWF